MTTSKLLKPSAQWAAVKMYSSAEMLQGMRHFKKALRHFKIEMRHFKKALRHFKIEMRHVKIEMRYVCFLFMESSIG